MIDGVNIPTLPGYVSIKEAANLLGVSDKRVYQYVQAGRLSAQRIGHILIIPEEEVKHFQPSPSGRVRIKDTPWRAYRSSGGIVVMEVSAKVRRGRQEHLIEQLQTIQKTEQHLFPGTIARYVVKGDEALTWVRCFRTPLRYCWRIKNRVRYERGSQYSNVKNQFANSINYWDDVLLCYIA